MQAKNSNGPLAGAECAQGHTGLAKHSNSGIESQRILPINLNAERSVLGAVIEDDDAILPEIIASGLRVEDFSLADHRRIYEAMLKLWQEKKPVDMVSLTERLGNRPVDAVTVASLIQGVIVHPDHVLHHVEIVREKARLRGLLRIGEWIIDAVDDTADSDALVEETISRLERIARPEVRA